MPRWLRSLGDLSLTTHYSQGANTGARSCGLFLLRATFEAAMSETIPYSRYVAGEYLERCKPAPDLLPTQDEVRRELG